MTPATIGLDPGPPFSPPHIPGPIGPTSTGLGPRMRAIHRMIERVAEADASVLILGETGVGKDRIARAIHARSSRRDCPFVRLNCAALPAELLESELFGHEKGAFTGAHEQRPGRFELADGGTILLDEIAEVPPALQATLLHVLQDLAFYRVGGLEPVRVQCRVIASTNRDLVAAMARGEFREDLYYRLNVVEIQVPPLRERREEIPGLVEEFLARFNQQYERRLTLDEPTLAVLREHAWPGNVRELENVIRRLVVLGDAGRLRAELSSARGTPPMPPAQPAPASGAALPVPSLRDVARRAAFDAERQALGEVLHRVRWNRTKAARVLRVSYKTLLRKMAEYGIAPDPGA